MKRYLVAAAGAAFAALVVVAPRTASAQAQAGKSAEPAPAMTAAEKTVFDNERAIYELLQKQDWNKFAAWVDGTTYVDMGGINPSLHTSQMMDGLKNLVTKSFEFTNMHALTLTPDVIVITYTVAVDQTAAGKHVPSPIHSMSVWQKKGRKWVAVAHSETTAADAK